MSAQPYTQQVRWQDMKVRGEVDIILEIAQKEGWEDCEIFGSGDMITQPQESMGWKLIPADLYKYSIPVEGVERLRLLVNAGIRIQGVIIADDKRNTETPSNPAIPEVSLQSFKTNLSGIGKAVLGIIRIAGVIALVSLVSLLVIFLSPLFGLFYLVGGIIGYDPKLVILVDDGNGGTVWISFFTWYD